MEKKENVIKVVELNNELIDIIYQMGDICLKAGGNQAMAGVNLIYSVIQNAPIKQDNEPESND
jgi:hypothetical protein